MNNLIGGADGIRTHYLLTASQIVFRQKLLDRKIPNELYLRESRLGGESNVNIKSNETRLLNMEGGGRHEDQGGSR